MIKVLEFIIQLVVGIVMYIAKIFGGQEVNEDAPDIIKRSG